MAPSVIAIVAFLIIMVIINAAFGVLTALLARPSSIRGWALQSKVRRGLVMLFFCDIVTLHQFRYDDTLVHRN